MAKLFLPKITSRIFGSDADARVDAVERQLEQWRTLIETGISSAVSGLASETYVSGAVEAAFLASFPVGTVISGPDSGDSPDTYLPGMSDTTWTRIQGRVIVGASDSDNDFDLNDTGGAKTVTLTSAQSGLPAHSHVLRPNAGIGTSGSGYGLVDSGNARSTAGAGATTNNNTAANASQAHNNLQPYKAKYLWERTV